MIEVPKLSEVEWEELVGKLTLHAHSKLIKLYWRGVPYAKGGAIPGAPSAQDFAAEAIEAFLDGTRTWDKTKHPDFLQFLLSVVDSKINHLVESAENRKTRRIDTAKKHIEPAYELRGKSKRPDEIVIDEEARRRNREAVLAVLGDDKLAKSLFECIEAEITKPAEIAEYLGLDVSDVNNAQKRLRRAVDKAFVKLGRSRK
ncbi:hypothetical protein [Rubinisphaera italica]|uniref:RNA polymerase sigma factor n=1 Tax=Rubinisphaera italica TaxID=2527969 RepID=A0A5C5XDW0_9PLAN|nr:hypothetical protein [Rubinisphaera italica]TWT60974.1 hypothetical protein Pan54_17060 [Rubinisphaera italica]